MNFLSHILPQPKSVPKLAYHVLYNMVCPLDSVLFISRLYQDSFIKVKLLLTGSFEMRWEFSRLLENKALTTREGAGNIKAALKMQSKRQPTVPLPQER